MFYVVLKILAEIQPIEIEPNMQSAEKNLQIFTKYEHIKWYISFQKGKSYI